MFACWPTCIIYPFFLYAYMYLLPSYANVSRILFLVLSAYKHCPSSHIPLHAFPLPLPHIPLLLLPLSPPLTSLSPPHDCSPSPSPLAGFPPPCPHYLHSRRLWDQRGYPRLRLLLHLPEVCPQDNYAAVCCQGKKFQTTIPLIRAHCMKMYAKKFSNSISSNSLIVYYM